MKIKIAAAAADYQRRYSTISFDMQAAARWFADKEVFSVEEDIVDCPVYGSPALAHGYPWVEWNFEPQDDGSFHRSGGKVWFEAHSLNCSICRLHLTSHAELLAAGLQEQWVIENADPHEFETPDYDEKADLQRWLDEQGSEEG